MNFLDAIEHPPVIGRRRSPINVSSQVMGWIVAILSVLFLLALAAVGIPSVRSTLGVGHPGTFAIAIVGLLLVGIAQVAILVGAIQMIRGRHSGRRIVIVSLLLSVIFSLIYNIGLANAGQFVVQFVVRLALYYFCVISRFPDESSA